MTASGAATAAPRAEPVLKMPTPMARCSVGNHSRTALTAAGKLPGSIRPSRKRNPASDHLFQAKPCSICATDHPPTNRMKPTRVPTRSTTQPDTAYMIA